MELLCCRLMEIHKLKQNYLRLRQVERQMFRTKTKAKIDWLTLDNGEVLLIKMLCMYNRGLQFDIRVINEF